MSEKPYELKRLNKDQRAFFDAGRAYPDSVTAQGIELYRICKERELDYENVFDEVKKDKELLAFTERIHRSLGEKLYPHLKDFQITESGFVGILSAVVIVAEALFEAERAGRPVSEVELTTYLENDFTQLVTKAQDLRKRAQRKIDEAESDQEKAELEKTLRAALSQLEETFNSKVLKRAAGQK